MYTSDLKQVCLSLKYMYKSGTWDVPWYRKRCAYISFKPCHRKHMNQCSARYHREVGCNTILSLNEISGNDVLDTRYCTYSTAQKLHPLARRESRLERRDFRLINNDSIGSSEASFQSEAVVHISAKSMRCNAKIKWCHRRPPNVFNVKFSSLPFRFFVGKSTFVSLEAACKNNSWKTRCSRRANFTATREIHRFLAS